MNLEYQHLLPEDFSPQSRVWIYQSSRLFFLSEALNIETGLQNFVNGWTSHGAEVRAYGNLFFGQFLVLIADETRAGVSGCSTDASVRFVKALGEQFKVDFFSRTNLAFFVKDKIQILPMAQMEYAVSGGFIEPDTLYFNNLVGNLEALRRSWIIPVKNSWIAPRLGWTADAKGS